MKKKIVYEDLTEINGEPFKVGKLVPNFLPSPEELIGKEKTVKVTLALTERALDYFKKEARSHNTSYQRMIRNLVSSYEAAHRKGT